MFAAVDRTVMLRQGEPLTSCSTCPQLPAPLMLSFSAACCLLTLAAPLLDPPPLLLALLVLPVPLLCLPPVAVVVLVLLAAWHTTCIMKGCGVPLCEGDIPWPGVSSPGCASDVCSHGSPPPARHRRQPCPIYPQGLRVHAASLQTAYQAPPGGLRSV